MNEPIEPPSDLAARMFAAERARADADPAQAARVLARVGASVGAVAVVGTVAATAGATGAGTAAHLGTAAKLGLTAKAAPWIAVAFLAGGGTGAAVHAVATRAPVVVASAPPSAIPAPRLSHAAVMPAELPPLVAEPMVSAPGPTAISSAPRPSASRDPQPSGNDTDLAGERALIERARMALARGQAASALEALDAHRAQYPRGRLGEEREALAIQALSAAGRSAEARKRADAFVRVHPNSVFLPAIELAVPPAKNDTTP